MPEATVVGYEVDTSDNVSPLFCPPCADDVTRDVNPLTEADLENFSIAKCSSCGATFYSDENTPTTDEVLEYAVAEDGGSITLTIATCDDEGANETTHEEIEVAVPDRGVLLLEIEGEEVALAPNASDGNPRSARHHKTER